MSKIQIQSNTVMGNGKEKGFVNISTAHGFIKYQWILVRPIKRWTNLQLLLNVILKFISRFSCIINLLFLLPIAQLPLEVVYGSFNHVVRPTMKL